MDKQTINYLTDIKKSITNIETFCAGRPRQFQVFCDDLCFKSAIQWEIAVIGEAMNRILKKDPQIKSSLLAV